MKRWFACLLIGAMIGALLTGCTANATSEPSPADSIGNALNEQSDPNDSGEAQQNPASEEAATGQQKDMPSDAFLMDLRETMNLSFAVIDAMANKDYASLEVIKSKDITIDQENDRILYSYGDQIIEQDFLENLSFGNLEYWGSGYLEDATKFQIVFAKYVEDTHGTIYFEFVKEGREWLFSGLITNA